MSKPEAALSRGTIMSLVAALACALAGEASASQPGTDASRAERGSGQRISSARVGGVAARIRQALPGDQRDKLPTFEIAQWRNR